MILCASMTDTHLRNKLRHLPTSPGVYLMKDAGGQVLYVGKAKSLRPRVRSYFTRTASASSLKTRELVKRVDDVETIVVQSEAEALILENNLIKEYGPRFNISLRDDKTYPYIKVTVQEPFPRVMVTRRLAKDEARYFGPYTNVRQMRQTLELVKKLYTVRSCHYDLPREAPRRPCLDYHIARCKAPCVALQSEADYREMIQEILNILEGHTGAAEARIRREMEAAAMDLHFERAAELRDALERVRALTSSQTVMDLRGRDRDVLGLARDAGTACGVVLRIRNGKLLGREALFLENLDDEPDAEVLSAFAVRYYTGTHLRDNGDLPREILVPADFPDLQALAELLQTSADRALRISVPKRGSRMRLIELAKQNAVHLLQEPRDANQMEHERTSGVVELQQLLELETVPEQMVCFDISHTQGSETVASAVTFRGGTPDKAGYRKMRIKGDWGNDDFRSMHEAVSRYFRRLTEEESPRPDLVVIDGGKGQLSAALRALEEVGLPQQPTVGLAKREEEVYLPRRAAPLRLPGHSPALRLLQRIRDEAHRFAVTYNRKLRTKRTIGSELSQIPGVGPARQRALLERFGSLRAIRRASPEELAGVPGIGARLAKEILGYLTEDTAVPPASP